MARLVALAVGGARVGVPPRGRAARRPVARDAARGDDARPVEDRAPGRDRRGLRDDRLPPLQRRVHGADLRGAAGLRARRVEPARVPAARGLRLRGLAVQLHRDRRQPHLVAGAARERRRLEAGVDGDALGLLPHARLPGGRAPGRRDQPRLRLRRRDRRRRAREPRPRRHPLHRLDRRLQRDVGDGRLERRPVPELPADRRRDGRKGLHRRPPLRRPRRGRGRDRPRLVRVPGAEVLGGVTRLRAVEPVAGAAGAARRRGRDDRRSATSPTSRPSWAP